MDKSRKMNPSASLDTFGSATALEKATYGHGGKKGDVLSIYLSFSCIFLVELSRRFEVLLPSSTEE
jgi:hypothetical protein